MARIGNGQEEIVRRRVRPMALPKPATHQLDFGSIYGMPNGGRRRRLLLEWLATPDSTGGARCVYVNRKWQANLVDPDLQFLLKKGLLVQRRDGGGRQHPLNRSSRKRQSYLVLAAAVQTN